MKRSLVFAFLFLSLSLSARAGVVTTVAGIPGIPGYWDGPATDAMFTHPTWIDVVAHSSASYSCEGGRSGEIFVVDRINGLIRRIGPDGFVTTFAVKTPLDFDSAFGGGILVEPPGSGCGCGIYARGIFVSSTGGQQVKLLAFDGSLASRDAQIILGTAGNAGSRDGYGSEAAFRLPSGIGRSWKYVGSVPAQSSGQSLYIADSGNHTIRRTGFILSFEACPQNLNVQTLAGSPGEPGSADGKGRAARFNTPRGVAGAPDGSVYVSDSGNHTIRRIAPDGTVTTVAGEAGVPGSNDGPALQAHLNTPSGIDVNEKGEVFIADTFNHTIRMLTTDGQLITIAGQPGIGGFADGDSSTALFNAPVGLKIAPDGSIVIADTSNNVIRRLTR